MPKSGGELAALMKEADPDGSGEIDFEEFVTVLQKQTKEGGGGLASAVSGASSFFGWISSPLSWFAPVEPPAAVEPQWRSPVQRYGGGNWSIPIRNEAETDDDDAQLVPHFPYYNLPATILPYYQQPPSPART